MKKIFISLAAIAAAICTISCNKDNAVSDMFQNMTEVNYSERTMLTVGISSPATKSTTITAENEVTVNNLQVLVFRGEALDAYGTDDNVMEVTVNCTAGERTVYALVNAPDLSGINTKAGLLAATSELSNNSGTSFEMIGSKEVTLPQAEKISIEVSRITSKVVIKKITRDFTSEGLADLDFIINEIYLTNVVGDINYGLNANPETWYNQMGYEDGMEELTHDAPGATITDGTSYETVHSFYCYPNDAEDSSSATWGPRRTRLVVKATLGTETYYYPITLPVLENNKCYEIAELKITRPGSDTQDTPVSFQDCAFEITVKPWNVVAVTDGLVI